MTPWQEFFDFLASGAGTILLALLAGAGGSILLELIWRPRRDKRRVAALLLTEVGFNTELLLLHAHARFEGVSQLPSDLILSTMAWDAAGGLVSELPTEPLGRLILLYNKFKSLNRHVEGFADVLRRRDALPVGSTQRATVDAEVLTVIDVFNTGVDRTIADAQALIPRMIALAKIPKDKETCSGI